MQEAVLFMLPLRPDLRYATEMFGLRICLTAAVVHVRVSHICIVSLHLKKWLQRKWPYLCTNAHDCMYHIWCTSVLSASFSPCFCCCSYLSVLSSHIAYKWKCLFHYMRVLILSAISWEILDVGKQPILWIPSCAGVCVTTAVDLTKDPPLTPPRPCCLQRSRSQGLQCAGWSAPPQWILQPPETTHLTSDLWPWRIQPGYAETSRVS